MDEKLAVIFEWTNGIHLYKKDGNNLLWNYLVTGGYLNNLTFHSFYFIYFILFLPLRNSQIPYATNPNYDILLY